MAQMPPTPPRWGEKAGCEAVQLLPLPCHLTSKSMVIFERAGRVAGKGKKLY